MLKDIKRVLKHVRRMLKNMKSVLKHLRQMLECETNVKKYEMSDELQEDNKSGSTKG